MKRDDGRMKRDNGNSRLQEALSSALTLHEAGDLKRAAIAYKEILRSDPECTDAIRYLGLLEMQRGRHEVALHLFETGLDHEPASVDLLVERGNALSALGMFSEALQAFNRALSVDPGALVAHFNRANVLREMNALEEALDSYDRVLAVVPDNVPALFNRSDVLQRLKRYEEALNTYDRCLALAPHIPGGMSNRGRFFRSWAGMRKRLQATITRCSSDQTMLTCTMTVARRFSS